MDNTSQLRLEYVDLCKVFAMFLVTMAHCAQKLSGNLFPEMILSKDLFISFNMPLFMIASGFVIISFYRILSQKVYFSNKYSGGRIFVFSLLFDVLFLGCSLFNIQFSFFHL